jgi:DNA-binding NtrC family response regulator
MMANALQPDEINVLASRADWDWPGAVRNIFKPRGVNLLVVENTNDIVNVLQHRRIRTVIVDTDPPRPIHGRVEAGRRQGGLWTLKIIRAECPALPCILLTSDTTKFTLDEALRLDVFSVIDKPVDMRILKDQMNRLFVKMYGSHIFSS